MKKITLMNSFMVMGLAMAIAFAPAGAFAREGKNDKNENKNSCLRAYGHLVAPGWIKMKEDLELKGRCWFPFGIGKKFKSEVDVTPPTISAVVALAQNTSVSVGWKTNEPATAKVYYGTTTPLVTTAVGTLSVQDTDLEKKHLIDIPNLSANTQYYMKIESKDAAGNIQSSTEFSAMTGI